MEKPNVFVLRAWYGKYTDAFQKGNYIGIGWFDEDPISGNWNLSDRDFLKEKYKEKYPADSLRSGKVGVNVGQVFRFLSIKVGDLVICPCENRALLLVGKVKGELYFKADDSSPYPWRKDIEWFETPLQRRELSVTFQDSLKSPLSCFCPNPADEILSKFGLLNEVYDRWRSDSKTAQVSNSELIRLKLLDLDATEFEYLVAYLLKSLGFDSAQEIGKPGDGGIDFEGVLDVSGIVSVKLQVQVKKRVSSSVSEKEIREFRGALKKGYQGCFITLSTFAEKAKDSAVDSEKEPIQLIDGKRFIEIFIEQYDRIIEEMYKDEMSELADKLKFEKTLIPS